VGHVAEATVSLDGSDWPGRHDEDSEGLARFYRGAEARKYQLLRVAHFVHRYPPALGGSEAYFARLGRYLAAEGDHVTVFTTAAYDLEAFWSPRGRCVTAGVTVEDGVTVRRYPLRRIRGQGYALKALSLLPHRSWQALTISCNPLAFGMWRDAGRLRESFDVVHATAFPYAWPLMCARRLARRLGVPFLLTPFLHLGDLDDPTDRTRRAYTRPALMALLDSADRVFVQTKGEYQSLVDRGFAPGKLVLQGMGVDLESCTGGERAKARQNWGLGETDVAVGHLANNSIEKGSVDLLRAAEAAWTDGALFTIVLAGPAMPNFERFWNSFGPKDRVRRLGILTEQQKRDFYAGIDVFALPSRSDSFGIVLLEAWANGVPSVGYRAGGVGFVIRDGIDGLLVRCGDLSTLAQTLRKLSADDALRRTLGEVGRERVRHEFRWESKLKLVREAYLAQRPAEKR
jgi:glycosyltransferase involved in cell wall biosynthesis